MSHIKGDAAMYTPAEEGKRPGTNNQPALDRGASVSRAPRGRGMLRRLGVGAVLLLVAVALVAAGVRWHETIGGWFGREGDGHDHGAQAAASGKKQLWTCGMHPQVLRDEPGTCPICHMKLTPVKTGDETPATAAAGKQRKIKYWWDPMLGPSSISDKPGKSAMGMDLVPVYEDEVSGGAAVTIDPVVVQNMGVRVAEVTRGPVKRTIRAVGYLAEAQPLIHDVNLRVSGWIEKLYADTEGEHLKKGDPLFDLYSPEVQVAVGELIANRTAAASLGPQADELARRNLQVLVASNRQKLEQWGLDPQQIEKLAKLDRAPRTVTFFSPITGHVTQKNIVEGAAVSAGQRALQLVDHSTLWLDAQVFEQDLPFISKKLGQKVIASVESMPGKTIEGEVIFVHPHVDPVTRTATVRMALPNPDLTLRPGMYATARITAQLAEEALLVPREAVIDTGAREVVFVAAGKGRFEPRNVKLGAPSAEGMVQVLSGLAPGETVVTSGQFLLDAESRMKEAIQKHLDKGLLAKSGDANKVPAGAPTSDAMKPYASVPASTRPGGAGERPVPRLKWSADVDRVFEEYLGLQKVLAAPQQPDAKALDVGKLVQAAQALVKVTTGELQRIPRDVLNAASAMQGKALEEQRRGFKQLSNAVIAMAETCPPSTAVADKLYVAYCPMAFDNQGGHWLQEDETIANPYYATDMKRCGEVKRTIEAVAATPSEVDPGAAAPGVAPTTMPSSATQPAAAQAGGGVDAVATAYLEVSRALGARQTADKPVAVANLVEAAEQMAGHSARDAAQLAHRVSAGAAAMDGRPLAEQRKLFKPLSEAAIALLDRFPPSKAAAGGEALYVAHCPMASANGSDWIQSGQKIANPYYATEMKQCGQIERPLAAAAGPATLPAPE